MINDRNFRKPNRNKISQQIVDFVIETKESAVPKSAIRVARLSLFDWLAVSVSGRNESVSKIVRNHLIKVGGVEEAVVIGTQNKLPARSAAMTNGTTSHSLDYDDTHFAYLGHPSVAVFPAALAISQKVNSSGSNFLYSALIGMETVIRIGSWLGHQHHSTGFHSTATLGCFGSAMASARLLHLSKLQTSYALGLAASCASGLRVQFGTMAKPFHAGMAAASGVESALLAQAGLVSSLNALEGLEGFASTHGSLNKSPKAAFKNIGSLYLFEEILHKFHACCHGLHASLEALIKIQNNYLFKLEELQSIKITVPHRYLNFCNIQKPKTGLEAKFSFRLCAAMILNKMDTSAISSFSDDLCQNQNLISLMDKVFVEGCDKLAETEANVEILTGDHRKLKANHDIALSLNYELRETKIREKGKALLGEKNSNDLWKVVETAEPLEIEEWLLNQN